MIHSKSTYWLLFVFLTSIGATAQAQQKAPAPAITYENVSYGDHANQVMFTSDNGPHREGGADPHFFGGRRSWPTIHPTVVVALPCCMTAS